MLALFFLANAIACALLIGILRVKDPIYQTFPWIFGAAFGLSAFPWIRRKMESGPFLPRLLPTLLYAAVIALASGTSPKASVSIASNPFHPVEFAGLSFLAQYAVNAGLDPRPRPRLVILACLGCMLFGVLDEIHQYFVPNRTAAVEDVLLDCLGVLVGAASFLLLRLTRRKDPDAGLKKKDFCGPNQVLE